MVASVSHARAVVTGGGSGVGRAVALALSAKGRGVVILGRHEQTLRETIELADEVRSRADHVPMTSFVCDVSDPADVAAMAASLLGISPDDEPAGAHGVDLLVNCAGINVPNRSLAELSYDDYQKIISINLTGAYLCCQAFLPHMRRHRRGTIVNIISDAGLRASAKAGPAYVASKFALRGLTQSINAEERHHGIRACGIFPGDIDTPLLNKRPVAVDAEARRQMLQPQDIAACALLAIELPPRAIVEELVVRPAG